MIQPLDDSLVDIVIPAYNESPGALDTTLAACGEQTTPVHSIFVVDDGSLTPVTLPQWTDSQRRFSVYRLPENQGISAARNFAIARSSSTFLACVNVEVLPQSNWVDVCVKYLVANPHVGACYTRTVPENPNSLLTRWRLRFQDARFPERTGPAPFAHGHAVLFRRAAIDAVGGYDVRFRVANEDSDISSRLWASGWEVHFISESQCVSIQSDTLKTLARKQLRDNGWTSEERSSLLLLGLRLTKWTIVRAARNVVKMRFYFLPIDAALWGYTLWLACAEKMKQLFTRRTER